MNAVSSLLTDVIFPISFFLFFANLPHRNIQHLRMSGRHKLYYFIIINCVKLYKLYMIIAVFSVWACDGLCALTSAQVLT